MRAYGELTLPRRKAPKLSLEQRSASGSPDRLTSHGSLNEDMDMDEMTQDLPSSGANAARSPEQIALQTPPSGRFVPGTSSAAAQQSPAVEHCPPHSITRAPSLGQRSIAVAGAAIESTVFAAATQTPRVLPPPPSSTVTSPAAQYVLRDVTPHRTRVVGIQSQARVDDPPDSLRPFVAVSQVTRTHSQMSAVGPGTYSAVPSRCIPPSRSFAAAAPTRAPLLRDVQNLTATQARYAPPSIRAQYLTETSERFPQHSFGSRTRAAPGVQRQLSAGMNEAGGVHSVRASAAFSETSNPALTSAAMFALMEPSMLPSMAENFGSVAMQTEMLRFRRYGALNPAQVQYTQPLRQLSGSLSQILETTSSLGDTWGVRPPMPGSMLGDKAAEAMSAAPEIDRDVTVRDGAVLEPGSRRFYSGQPNVSDMYVAPEMLARFLQDR